MLSFMAWTLADLTAVEDAIRAKITGGAIQSYATDIGGRNVTHMSLESLQKLRAEIAEEIAATAAQSTSDFTLLRTRPA
jgi:chemotaxis receptor (MCP) glutamine deamidase CheD